MTEPTTDPTAPTEPTTDPAKEFTPPATQADLDRIIADRVARTKAQFKDYTELKSKAAEFDQLIEAGKSDLEKSRGELTRWQTEAQTWRKAAIGNRIEALASAEFADPSDAVSALADKEYLDAGGQINEEAIKTDLAAVLERKPHWRRAAEGTPAPRVPAPNRAQGTSGGAPAADPAQQFAAIVQGQLKQP